MLIIDLKMWKTEQNGEFMNIYEYFLIILLIVWLLTIIILEMLGKRLRLD